MYITRAHEHYAVHFRSLSLFLFSSSFSQFQFVRCFFIFHSLFASKNDGAVSVFNLVHRHEEVMRIEAQLDAFLTDTLELYEWSA